jgi:5-methylcytosine-specific restriction enzyme subunit McrC
MIPIKNIYYLLCYAWDKWEEKDWVNISAEDQTDLLNLLSKIFVKGANTLLKRGLQQHYILQKENFQGIKGKIDFNDSIRKNLFSRGFSSCEFDELSADILPNQVIKTTLENLLKTSGVSPIIKKEVQAALSKFSTIKSIVLTEKTFQQTQHTKSNSYYLFLLSISELLYNNLLLDENTGSFKFKDFMRDERQMARIFEHFIRNFYKIELSNAKVFREDLHWKISGDERQFLPKMQTDISIQLGNRKLIIDAKYYKETFQKYYNAEKIHSQNLYQLFAYLKNQPCATAEGILLYPTIEKSVSLHYTHEGHTIKIETLNLNQDWKGIREDLFRIIN